MRKLVVVVSVFILLCVALASGRSALARWQCSSLERPGADERDCGYDVQLDIAPAQPTQDDAIQVICSGDWSDSCVPWRVEQEMWANVIMVHAIADYPPDVVCLTVITPWRLVADVGTLAPGFYKAMLYITDTRLYGATALCATESFTVVEMAPRAYFPVVTKRSEGM